MLVSIRLSPPAIRRVAMSATSFSPEMTGPLIHLIPN